MNFREAWNEGEIEAGTLLDEIDNLMQMLQESATEIEQLLTALTDALEVGSHLMSAASYERARRLVHDRQNNRARIAKNVAGGAYRAPVDCSVRQGD